MGTIRPDRGLGEDLIGGICVPETKSSHGWRAHLPEGMDPERLDLLAAGSLPAAWKRLAEVAVVGAPSEEWGEQVVAFVVPAAPPDRDELLAFAAERLAGFKRPRVVHYVEALPRNALGKVMKHELGA